MPLTHDMVQFAQIAVAIGGVGQAVEPRVIRGVGPFMVTKVTGTVIQMSWRTR